MNLQEARETVSSFMLSTERLILDKFANSDRSSVIINNDDDMFRSVLIPGKRKDRALLVAHVDTVWHDTPNIKLAYTHNLIYSGSFNKGLDKKNEPISRGYGIGADDRAGIAILWALRELGHSILITNSEECGCLGSCAIMANRELAAYLQEHTFAVQFDRRNKNDLVFYNVGSKRFTRYCEANTGYIKAHGTFSDIGVLCEQICGVNISVGYRNEHTEAEILNLHWWLETLTKSEQWLKRPLEKFNRPIIKRK